MRFPTRIYLRDPVFHRAIKQTRKSPSLHRDGLFVFFPYNAVQRTWAVAQVPRTNTRASAMPSIQPAETAGFVIWGVGACWRVLRGNGREMGTGGGNLSARFYLLQNFVSQFFSYFVEGFRQFDSKRPCLG
jgi:hypothetical protein